MSTKTMVAVMFILCILGLIFGVAYGAITHNGGPAACGVVFGGTGALIMAALNQDLEG